ncbi:MAG TPA: hypothetical protein VFY39_01720, partial [Gammaproteobacteria bacterium]|nr:hypothetical protein [Gammaproteobacteria bacterium]
MSSEAVPLSLPWRKRAASLLARSLLRLTRGVWPAVAALAALSVSFPAGARSLQEVLNHGTLRVGVALYAPWAL